MYQPIPIKEKAHKEKRMPKKWISQSGVVIEPSSPNLF
jgi:hypothetical protein